MKRQTPVVLPEGYVDFFIELESLQNEQQIKLSKKYSYEFSNVKQLLIDGNKPLLMLKGISINENDYAAIVLIIINFMKQNRPDTKIAMEKLKSKSDNLDYNRIINVLTGQNDDRYFTDLAKNIDIPPDLLLFICDHALRPFLRIYAASCQEALTKNDEPFWPFPNTCPICGSKSQFSRLRSSDSRRFMFCDRCFSEWESRYLQCIHCGNDDPESIKYSSVENDDAYQVYLCDKCRGYLKTFDERQSKEITDLFIAGIETVYLDMLAEEKGYTNHDK